MMRLNMHIRRFELTPRNHAKLMREVNRNVMIRHQYERLPDHFEEVAYSRYGARPRATSTNKYKRKKFGHIKPNVRRGTLKKSVFANIKITATQNGSKLTTRGTTKTRLQGWQLRELQSMSPAEKQLENKRMAREYKAGATSAKYMRKRSKRTK